MTSPHRIPFSMPLAATVLALVATVFVESSEIRAATAVPATTYGCVSRFAKFTASGQFLRLASGEKLGLTGNTYVVTHGWAPGYRAAVTRMSMGAVPAGAWDPALKDANGTAFAAPWFQDLARALKVADNSATILVFSWVDLSATNSLAQPWESQAFTDWAGDRLADCLHFIDQNSLSKSRIHLLGHSHGAKVVTKASLRLKAVYKHRVSQISLFDSPEEIGIIRLEAFGAANLLDSAEFLPALVPDRISGPIVANYFGVFGRCYGRGFLRGRVLDVNARWEACDSRFADFGCGHSAPIRGFVTLSERNLGGTHWSVPPAASGALPKTPWVRFRDFEKPPTGCDACPEYGACGLDLDDPVPLAAVDESFPPLVKRGFHRKADGTDRRRYEGESTIELVAGKDPVEAPIALDTNDATRLHLTLSFSAYKADPVKEAEGNIAHVVEVRVMGRVAVAYPAISAAQSDIVVDLSPLSGLTPQVRKETPISVRLSPISTEVNGDGLIRLTVRGVTVAGR